MFKRFTYFVATAALLLSFAACSNKKVTNPIAQVDSKQPDKILFDRAMDAMKHNKFDVARLTLQTLINTYPESEFVARAKLAVGDSWYAEGGSAALAQAENEYKDFITFFPNMPEAAEAQLKIANIHYQAMEKPDRDFTHAKRAEEEYRTLLQQWPDSKLVPEAKQRLRNVQEVLAEREFRIGRFYYLRENWAAAEARLQSLVDAYPLYSAADEALFLLGDSYEKRAETIRAATQISEAARGKLIKESEDKAAAAYDRIITRYPEMTRAADAKVRLEAMRRPVPTPTAEAIAQNKAEQESRGKSGMWDGLMANLRRGPSTSVVQASKVGEPTVDDPKQVSAPELMKESQKQMIEAIQEAAGTKQSPTPGKVSVETVKKDATPGPNQPVPRSDSGQASSGPDNTGIPELQPIQDSTAQSSDAQAQTATPPPQVNEVEAQKKQEQQQAAAPADGNSTVLAQSSDTSKADGDKKQPDFSSSKKKEKKGLRKIVPF